MTIPYTIYDPASNPEEAQRSMSTPLSCTWSGVFPAATTQFDRALEVDLPATQKVQKALLDDGVHGLVLMGTVGEGNSLTAEEKRKVLKAAVEVSAGKVPVIAGVSELTTAAAAAFARDAERLGAAGLMVLPAMVYVPTPAELEHHFRMVAAASGLPIMLYNNPPSYRVNIDIATLQRLAEVPTIVSIKESAPDSRRFTDIINAFGERFVLFAGLDDIAFEGLSLGAKGWVSPTRFRWNRCACMKRCARATSNRRAGFTAGSCRCCTWTLSTTWCNPSSSRSRLWAAVRSAFACRDCRCRASGAQR
jgi:hypothetical protein